MAATENDLTLLEVLRRAAGHLEKHGSTSARLDAEVLLAHALTVRRLDLYLQFDRPLADEELVPYRSLIARRAKGEPVAYLVGHKEFMALEFDVSAAVLVPNPDTEVLVQLAVAWARERGVAVRAADVGTGSGCIAVALAHYVPGIEIWASDDSQEALEVAQLNVRKHSLDARIHLCKGDLLAPLPGAYDLVCANLPYVPAATALATEVVTQPRHALYGGPSGSELVVRLLDAAPAKLKAAGRVMVEIDPAILPEVVAAAERGYAGHRVHRDLGGHDRVLEAWTL
jgi:release factor glutamine methyltransferase